MKLSDWYKQNNVLAKDLAAKVSVDASYISYLMQNKRRPSPDLALKIQEATGGQVTVWELLFPDKPICDPPQLMPQQPAAQDAA